MQFQALCWILMFILGFLKSGVCRLVDEIELETLVFCFF